MAQMEQIPEPIPEKDLLKFADSDEEIAELRAVLRRVQATRQGVTDELDEDRTKPKDNANSNIDGNTDEIVRKLGVE